jgi:hypothetical protein
LHYALGDLANKNTHPQRTYKQAAKIVDRITVNLVDEPRGDPRWRGGVLDDVNTLEAIGPEEILEDRLGSGISNKQAG